MPVLKRCEIDSGAHDLILLVNCALQSPVDPRDFAGLELDTEAQERNQHQDDQDRPSSTAKTAAFTQPDHTRLVSEKSLEADGLDDQSPSPPAPSYEAPIPKMGDAMKETVRRGQDDHVKERRICGLARIKFVILLVVICIIIIVAAVVGGVVGTRNASSPSSSPTPTTTAAAAPTTTPTTDPVAVNAGLPCVFPAQLA